MKKTATIERYPVRGTRGYELRVIYRGNTLSWNDGGIRVYAYLEDSAEGVEMAKAYARRFGFTHVRFVGDWEKSVKPRGGKL